MSRVEELEGQIKASSSSEFQELCAWLAEYDAEVWDRQFHADAISGRLDAIAPGDKGLFARPVCGTVTHRAAPSYDALDPEVRKLADKSFDALNGDLRHASLRLKKTGRFWSVRVGLNHRSLAIEIPGGLLWIGDHDGYDRM